ncbi:MAG: hypothetical protein Q7J47_07030 [Azoarcus sp.]|nr:hypothetical protein [Azoarcus sp.]
MSTTSNTLAGFASFANELVRRGEDAVGAADFVLDAEGLYELWYTPFEYVNKDARLVIVGITPGMNQLRLAYEAARNALQAGMEHDAVLRAIKMAGAFGGSSMRPNLLKMLRHFRFEQFLGVDDLSSLWGSNARLIHTTSVVPHAAFKRGKMFAGSFEEVLANPLLRATFEQDFVSTLPLLNGDAYFVALGPCPLDALRWCVAKNLLKEHQVLGALCHPSSSGGSMTRYYLREIERGALNPKDPVLHRCDWLDAAYNGMSSRIGTLLKA